MPGLKKHQPPGGWDAVLCMSGVAEESFQWFRTTKTVCVLHRGSTHIRHQWKLLKEEENRAGLPISKPSDWIISREEREYQLADAIRVQSPFALEGFQQFNSSQSSVALIPWASICEVLLQTRNKKKKDFKGSVQVNP